MYKAEIKADHIHYRASKGGERLRWSPSWSRRDCVTLHRLRLNRCEAFQATKARWAKPPGSVDTNCPFCLQGPEDTAHWLCSCPRWSQFRLEIFGSPDPGLHLLQEEPDQVLSFYRRCAPLRAQARRGDPLH